MLIFTVIKPLYRKVKGAFLDCDEYFTSQCPPLCCVRVKLRWFRFSKLSTGCSDQLGADQCSVQSALWSVDMERPVVGTQRFRFFY